MKILFFSNKVPDPCGAFFHDLYLAYYLRSKGHSVKFITVSSKNRGGGVFRNIAYSHIDVSASDLESADIYCCPHYPFANILRKYNERFEKPIVFVAHFGEDLSAITSCNRYGKWAEFLWVISDHIHSYIKNSVTISPSFVETRSIRPIIDEASIRLYTAPDKPLGECITLINANVMKGIAIFDKLARKFPERKFLGIRPYYNPIAVPNLKNIEWMDIQDDIKEILKKTKILIVPSAYESWGRVAFEAMYNGIPVLYSKPSTSEYFMHRSGTTEGMKEWIKDSAIECNRECIEDWINGIISLDDELTYNMYSKRGYDKTHEMNIESEKSSLEQDLLYYIKTYPAVKKNDKGNAPPVSENSVGINRFMSGGGIRRNPIVKKAPQPSVPAQAPPVQQVQNSRPSFRLLGGHFGMKR